MAEDSKAQQLEVSFNYESFEKKLDDLIGANEGKWALLREGDIVEIFDTVRDAHIAAWKLFSDDKFSVQEITKKPVDLGFFSYAGNPRASQ